MADTREAAAQPEGHPRLPASLRESPVPTAHLDAAGDWGACNAAMDAVLGEGPPGFADLVDEPGLDVAAALATPAILTLRVQLPGERPAEAVLTLWSDEPAGGRLVQFLDRTEVEDLRRRLNEAAAASERFVSRVSHDLKNPIGTARGYADLVLEDTALPEDIRGYVARIVSSTERAVETLVAIVADARSGSRVRSADDVDLAAVVDEVRDELDELITARGATVATAGELPALRTDARVLRRALAALVRNAVEHHPAAARVEVSARPAPGGWVIAVDDDGPGIPPADRATVVDAGATSGASPGHGLGLSLTRAAIARHAGELRLTDSDAGGLRAELLLPQRRARDPEVPATAV